MKLNDFLNPRSMLTPGIAGSVVMVIANSLWVSFTMPQKWTALILSFILVIPILKKFTANFFEKIIYFLLNGLIIFSLAINTNFAGKEITQLSEKPKPTSTSRAYYYSTYSTPSGGAGEPTEPQKGTNQFFTNWF